MRPLLLALLITIGTLVTATAGNDDIEATIDAQIKAFRADDFEQAFSYASPAIQGLFGTPENFGVMVRRGYPMVWRPAEVRYLDLRDINGQLWQRVLITDRTGNVHILDYEMVPAENGWKINAVQRVDAKAQSV